MYGSSLTVVTDGPTVLWEAWVGVWFDSLRTGFLSVMSRQAKSRAPHVALFIFVAGLRAALRTPLTLLFRAPWESVNLGALGHAA